MALQLNLLPPTAPVRPSFARTLSALGEIPAYLYRALEFGTERNRTFFKELSQNERPRPHIRESIVRDQGKRFLERNRFQVEEEAIVLGSEPLSALILRCGLIQIRVLKGPEGIVPGCGTSMRRRRFYNQQSDLYIDRSGGTRQTKLNLICLWEFDRNFNLAGLRLVYPIRAGEASADVLTEWNEPLPYPANHAGFNTDRAESEQLKAEAELEELLRDTDLDSDQETKKA